MVTRWSLGQEVRGVGHSKGRKVPTATRRLYGIGVESGLQTPQRNRV